MKALIVEHPVRAQRRLLAALGSSARDIPCNKIPDPGSGCEFIQLSGWQSPSYARGLGSSSARYPAQAFNANAALTHGCQLHQRVLAIGQFTLDLQALTLEKLHLRHPLHGLVGSTDPNRGIRLPRLIKLGFAGSGA